MMRAFKSSWLLCGAVMILSACGGGSSSSTSVTPPATGGGGSGGGSGTTDTPVILSDLVYGQGETETGDIDLLLDIHQPSANCTANRPTVFFVHGGGFQVGNKSLASITPWAEASTEKGFNFVSIDYRLVRNNPVLTPVFQDLLDATDEDDLFLIDGLEKLEAALAAFEDTVAALNWLQANQDEYCLDMDRLALWGASAGAVIVLNATYSSDHFGLSRPDPDVVINYWGGLLQPEDMDFMEAPFLTVHGELDATVDYQNALDLQVQAENVAVPYSFYTEVGGGHGVDVNKTVNGETLLDITMNYIEAHIVGGVPVYETANTD